MKREDLIQLIREANKANEDTVELIDAVEFEKGICGARCVWSIDEKSRHLNCALFGTAANGRIWLKDGWAYFAKDCRKEPLTGDQYWTTIEIPNNHGGEFTLQLKPSEGKQPIDIVSDDAVMHSVTIVKDRRMVKINACGHVKQIRIYGQIEDVQLSGKMRTEKPFLRMPVKEYTIQQPSDEAQAEIDKTLYYKAPTVIRY